jgi:hypothetical protein
MAVQCSSCVVALKHGALKEVAISFGVNGPVILVT